MSYIIDFIKSASPSESWRNKLGELNIKIKEKGDLAIFNYDVNADFTNYIVREARGIIIDIKKWQVVAFPFYKFCNIEEAGAQIDLENFDWQNCSVQEKIDGSIVKLYHYNNAWHWATNSCIDAEEASVNGTDRTYLDIIKSAKNYKDINFALLNPDNTYIFELVSPETQVVIRYPYSYLYHIGTRNNVTEKECDVDIGIKKPKVFPLNTLEDCLDAVEHLNDGLKNVKYEGFVVVDKNWSRVKIKNAEYLAAHKLWGNGNISKDRVITLIRNSCSDINSLYHEANYELKTAIKYYEYKMVELEWRVQDYIDYVRGLYEELGRDRKALSEVINHDEWAYFGYKSLNNMRTAHEILFAMPLSRYCTMIDDYRCVVHRRG